MMHGAECCSTKPFPFFVKLVSLLASAMDGERWEECAGDGAPAERADVRGQCRRHHGSSRIPSKGWQQRSRTRKAGGGACRRVSSVRNLEASCFLLSSDDICSHAALSFSLSVDSVNTKSWNRRKRSLLMQM